MMTSAPVVETSVTTNFLLCYQTGLSTGEESNHLESNVVKDIGYLGDVDTSSNESYESGSSDSEDNIPRATSKGTM